MASKHAEGVGLQKNVFTLDFSRRHELYQHAILHLMLPETPLRVDVHMCRHCGKLFVSWQNSKIRTTSTSCEAEYWPQMTDGFDVQPLIDFPGLCRGLVALQLLAAQHVAAPC